MLLVPRLSHGASSSLQKMRRDTLEACYFVTHKLGCRFSGDVFAGAGLPSLSLYVPETICSLGGGRGLSVCLSLTWSEGSEHHGAHPARRGLKDSHLFTHLPSRQPREAPLL